MTCPSHLPQEIEPLAGFEFVTVRASSTPAAPRAILARRARDFQPDLFGAQFFRWLVEVAAELVDMPGVEVDGVGSKVADLHILGHAFDTGLAAALEA